MGRRVLLVAVAVMMMAGITWAQGGAISGIDGKTTVSAEEWERLHRPSSFIPSDPIWNPSLDQMTGWVTAGLEAAAADMYLPNVAGISVWTWDGDTAAGNGRRLQWAALLTPQFVATITGYEAAWHDDIWQRVQAGEEQAVALELAVAVLSDWQPGGVRVVLGMSGSGDPRTAAWMGMWGSMQQTATITRGETEQRQGVPTAHWAALYYVSQVGMGQCRGIEVMIRPQQAYWDGSREVVWPRGDSMVDAIGEPDAPAGMLRIYAGAPAEWAFVEWTL
jgi:hypothetical protein